MAPVHSDSPTRRTLNLVEYAAEAWALGLFMVASAGFAVLLFHPASPVAATLPDPLIRRVLMGTAMGLTAILNIYSPWGRRSGAHMNPALTYAFFRLGKVALTDLYGYIVAQFLGALRPSEHRECGGEAPEEGIEPVEDSNRRDHPARGPELPARHEPLRRPRSRRWRRARASPPPRPGETPTPPGPSRRSGRRRRRTPGTCARAWRPPRGRSFHNRGSALVS